jgi:hypothetical protein
MLEDRKSSKFPAPASAWWILLLLAFGWVPLGVVTVCLFLYNPKAVGWFSAVWVWAVTFPCSMLAALSVLVQAFRLLWRFRNRPARFQQ